jgi:hypothetical protein
MGVVATVSAPALKVGHLLPRLLPPIGHESPAHQHQLGGALSPGLTTSTVPVGAML